MVIQRSRRRDELLRCGAPLRATHAEQKASQVLGSRRFTYDVSIGVGPSSDAAAVMPRTPPRADGNLNSDLGEGMRTQFAA